MKTLVVQGITRSDLHPSEVSEFYIPCMKSVKQWAKKRGYDYKAYSDAIEEEDYGQLLGIDLGVAANNQFYKFQWMRGHTNYDRIMWIDADIWVWGDPDPLGDEWFCCPIIFREHNPTWMTLDGLPWRRPNFGLFWGSSEGIEDWCTVGASRLYNPESRGDCTNYLLIRHRWAEPIICDEWFSSEWLHDNKHRIRQIRCEADWDYGTSDCGWYVNWPNVPTPNSFIHLAGPKKQQKFLQLKLFFEINKQPNLPIGTFFET